MRATFSPDTGRLRVLINGWEALLFPFPDMRAFKSALAAGKHRSFNPAFFRVSGGTLGCEDPETSRALEQFQATIPSYLVTLIAPFPDEHWALTAWAARTGVFSDDLLVANPCLAFMLAKAASMTGRKGLAPPVWATRPYDSQKRLLGKLGFPSTGQMRQVVRKILHSAVSVPKLRALRAAILEVPEILSRLSHVSRINANVLAAAAGGRLLVTPRLYAELAEPGHDDRLAPLSDRIAGTMRGWRLLHPHGPFPVFDRLEQIEARHEQIIEELRHYQTRAVTEFPPPPVPGTPSIVPLLSVADLVVEGRAQHNCVASYARLARRRQVALYKVLAPERATLSLVREDGVWRIDELETACNRGVSADTRTAVNHWLDEASR